MTKKHDIILTVLFCIFIGIMALGTAFLPKKEFSVSEKRTLAKFPEISVGKILDGKWESDFERYISDHFPVRETFVSADAYYMLFSGRNGVNGVYKGKDDYLINTPVSCDNEKLQSNMSALNSFAKSTGIKTKLMAVPTGGYIMSDKLPQIHRHYPDEDIRYNIEQQCTNAEFTDIFSELRGNSAEGLYYKTDHHWTSCGAYIAYRKWAESENILPRERDGYNIEQHEGFYGTTYSKSALSYEKPDTIELWKYPANVEITINDGAGDTKYDSMFFEEHLKEADKYPVFLDGNHAFVRIENKDNKSGMRLLILKDSFAHAFVPFIAEHCSVIDMVDLRYYLDSVSKLTEQNRYDEILALYGISSLCEANDLSILQ